MEVLIIDREQWLRERKKGIGGSDVAAILGLSKWKSAYDIWVDKTTDVLQEEYSNESIYWGNVLEEIVAQEFSKQTGVKVRRNNKILQHPEYYWMRASIDRKIVGENALLECKTTSEYNKNEWKDDEIPLNYILQCMHYLAVTGFEKCYIACLVGGRHFIYKEILRNEEVIKVLVEKERIFWQEHVEKNIPPEVDGSESCKKLLDSQYEPVDNLEVDLDNQNKIDLLVKDLEYLKSQKKVCDDQLKLIGANITETENKIKTILGAKGSINTQNYKLVHKDYEVKERVTKGYKYSRLTFKKL